MSENDKYLHGTIEQTVVVEVPAYRCTGCGLRIPGVLVETHADTQGTVLISCNAHMPDDWICIALRYAASQVEEQRYYCADCAVSAKAGYRAALTLQS